MENQIITVFDLNVKNDWGYLLFNETFFFMTIALSLTRI